MEKTAASSAVPRTVPITPRFRLFRSGSSAFDPHASLGVLDRLLLPFGDRSPSWPRGGGGFGNRLGSRRGSGGEPVARAPEPPNAAVSFASTGACDHGMPGSEKGRAGIHDDMRSGRFRVLSRALAMRACSRIARGRSCTPNARRESKAEVATTNAIECFSRSH